MKIQLSHYSERVHWWMNWQRSWNWKPLFHTEFGLKGDKSLDGHKYMVIYYLLPPLKELRMKLHFHNQRDCLFFLIHFWVEIHHQRQYCLLRAYKIKQFSHVLWLYWVRRWYLFLPMKNQKRRYNPRVMLEFKKEILWKTSWRFSTFWLVCCVLLYV